MSYEMFAMFQLELLAGRERMSYEMFAGFPTRAASKEEKVCLMRCLLCSN